jgi:YidC/Oxa1 family membrane protein insertase
MDSSLVALLTHLAQFFGGSLGWAIVALSLGIRVALLPLTLRLARRARRNQEIARALQPEIDALKRRFEKKPGRFLAELRALYRRHQYSPLDLPALLGSFAQLPVFALLYRAIGASLAAGGPFYWIRTLAAPDVVLNFLVLLLTGAAACYMPGQAEGARAALVAIQVLVTLLIVWQLAAGYGLYWASSSAVSLLQSLWLRREYARQTA